MLTETGNHRVDKVILDSNRSQMTVKCLLIVFSQFPRNSHPTRDFQLNDIAGSGLGLGSRLPIDNPGVWLGSGVGWAFPIPNPV